MKIGNLIAQAMVTVALGMPSSALGQTFYGPTYYYQASDSPFSGMSGLEIEDAEDGVFNLPGASSNHSRMGSSFAYGSVDSVDADDGVIDGRGIDGESFWGSGSITITFGVGGADLPQHAGLVWTDGFGNVTFEAWGAGNVYLGLVLGNHSDGYGNWWGYTYEDRFYGVSYAAGIERITVSNGGGIEIDHVQQIVVTNPVDVILDTLADLLNDGTINNGQNNALTNKLINALDNINDGSLTAGCNQLNAFTNQINALLTAGVLPAAEAQTLLDAAASIGAEAGC